MRKFLILLSAIMTGCTTVRYIPVETTRTDSVAAISTRTDSIAVIDSTMVDRTTDTVRITRWRTETRWHTQHDTVWHAHTDTIKVTVPQPVRNNTSATSLWHIIGNMATGIIVGLIAAVLLYRRLRA